MSLSPNEAPPAEGERGAAPPGSLVLRPIVVESRATLLIGLAMLLIGLAGGFLLRPIVMPATGATGGAALSSSLDNAASPAAPAQNLIGPSATGEAATQAAAVTQYLIGNTRHFRGSPDAPVVMVEFADFQCPYCGHFALDSEPRITAAYIDSGRVRFGYQHFAFLGPESGWAAEASECADEQGAFWEYHDLLFRRQAGENQGAFSKDNLKALAGELTLDRAAFDDCLDSGKYAELVQSETQAAQSIGVRSTPTFVINGQPVLGAQPFSVFQQYFEAALGQN